MQLEVRKLALNISANNCNFFSQTGIHKFWPMVMQDSRHSADTIWAEPMVVRCHWMLQNWFNSWGRKLAHPLYNRTRTDLQWNPHRGTMEHTNLHRSTMEPTLMYNGTHKPTQIYNGTHTDVQWNPHWCTMEHTNLHRSTMEPTLMCNWTHIHLQWNIDLQQTPVSLGGPVAKGITASNW